MVVAFSGGGFANKNTCVLKKLITYKVVLLLIIVTRGLFYQFKITLEIFAIDSIEKYIFLIL